jgi:hypothetical protein
MRTAVVFCPQNPVPPRTGFHRRALEMLNALRELGFKTVLASSALSSSAVWTTQPWNRQSVLELEHFVSKVELHEPSRFDLTTIQLLQKDYRRRHLSPPLSTRINTPPGMRRWFSRLVDRERPDVILMNYVMWDGLVDHLKWADCVRLVDTIDLITLNDKMWRRLGGALPPAPIEPTTVSDAFLGLDFFLNPPLEADVSEFQIHDRYTATIAITERERDVIKRSTRVTNVIHVPMTHPARDIHNTYSGPALFATGPNPFNVQGYLFFLRQVLPSVRKASADFLLQVTGHCAKQVRQTEGTIHTEFIPDLSTAYQAARFAICPVFGLTGQQVKIVEAMSFGVPVVALENAAAQSPIEHGVNGLVARNAAEFAEHVTRLWQDPALCRQLGQVAEETIRTQFSPDRLQGALAAVL